MSESKQPAFVVGFRFGEILKPVQGTITGTCERCFTKVLLAPTSQEIIREKRAQVICMRCFLEAKEFDDEIDIKMTKGQFRELQKELKDRGEVK